MYWNEIGTLNTRSFYLELEASSKAIAEQCRKARYLYLKGSLSEGLNLEVNQDKTVVEEYLQRYGLPLALIGSLNEAERLYREGSTPFQFKSCLGHLRSFLESVHSEVMPSVHAQFRGQLPNRWGEGLAYLRENGVLSGAEEHFVASLYTLISDEGVHPLVSEKEYARLARNFVVEYSLLFLRKVEKLGIKTTLAARQSSI